MQEQPNFSRIAMDKAPSSLSGYAALLGYELIDSAQGSARLRLALGPYHLNQLGIPHGGVIASLLDSALGHAVAFADGPEQPQHAVTLSLTVHYIAQAADNAVLFAEGRRSGGGRSVAFARGWVADETGRVVASGEGVFKYVRRRGEGNASQPAEKA